MGTSVLSQSLLYIIIFDRLLLLTENLEYFRKTLPSKQGVLALQSSSPIRFLLS